MSKFGKRRVHTPRYNAPVYKACFTVCAITSCGFQKLHHPPYNPDLTLSDFFFFSNLKKNLLLGRHFEDKYEHFIQKSKNIFIYPMHENLGLVYTPGSVFSASSKKLQSPFLKQTLQSNSKQVNKH